MESSALVVERVQVVGLRKLLSLGLEVLGGFAVCLEKEKARELAVHATGSAGNEGQERDAAVSVVCIISPSGKGPQLLNNLLGHWR